MSASHIAFNETKRFVGVRPKTVYVCIEIQVVGKVDVEIPGRGHAFIDLIMHGVRCSD